jgi:hypothetical protein
VEKIKNKKTFPPFATALIQTLLVLISFGNWQHPVSFPLAILIGNWSTIQSSI